MEDIQQDQWERLLEAARTVNGKPGSEQEAVPAPIERPAAGRVAPRLAWPLAARVLGALAVLAVGAIHLHEYETLYSAIPTIGTLFVLNFAGATAIGVGLLLPLGRILGRRWGDALTALLALAGVGLAATAFAFLTISEQTPLFGFMEPGYDPTGILASRIAEGLTVISLGAYVVWWYVEGHGRHGVTPER